MHTTHILLALSAAAGLTLAAPADAHQDSKRACYPDPDCHPDVTPNKNCPNWQFTGYPLEGCTTGTAYDKSFIEQHSGNAISHGCVNFGTLNYGNSLTFHGNGYFGLQVYEQEGCQGSPVSVGASDDSCKAIKNTKSMMVVKKKDLPSGCGKGLL